MNFYEKLLDKKVFSFEEISTIVGNRSYAKELVNKYLKKGYIKRVKRDLYVAISLESKESVANKFMIASKISYDSTVCSLSALEYYGFYNQVRNDCFVLSKTRFRNFIYENIYYTRLGNIISSGIITINPYIKVTDLEKSVIDTIKELDRHISYEELNNILSLIPNLKEEKLKCYLDEYQIQFMYQKTGYLLELHKYELGLSDNFFDYLKNKVNSKRYLINNSKNNKYISKWKLIVPILYESDNKYEIY